MLKFILINVLQISLLSVTGFRNIHSKFGSSLVTKYILKSTRNKVSNQQYDSDIKAEIIIAQGEVMQGYGRGSRKLGFATANLPLFSNELSKYSIRNGIYFGWAYVEGDTRLYPCVSNIGKSPTFVGQENAVNIIETHIIQRNDSNTQFYGHFLRLVLVEYIRPEIKFSSIDELVRQIEADVDFASRACQSAVISNNTNNKLTSVYYQFIRNYLIMPFTSDDPRNITTHDSMLHQCNVTHVDNINNNNISKSIVGNKATYLGKYYFNDNTTKEV